jgi:alcohol dehydrogenase
MKSNENTFNFILPAKVEFGPGALRKLPDELLRNDFKRAAFVATPGRKRSGMVDELADPLTGEGIEVAVYDRVKENPDVESTAECVRFLKENKPEVIIGLGGGSALDTAKAAGLCYTNGFEDIRELIDERKPKRKSLPTIMVPTTAGSGSEVNYWAVITDRFKREKLSVGSPSMSPHMALVDPKLTLTLPAVTTLYTGIDALTHAIESYFSSACNRLSDLLSLEAIFLAVKSLEQTVDEGGDLQARCDMALASLLSGMSMENVGLGLIHAMSHQISGYYNTQHGLANAILLPNVLEFNASRCRAKIRSLDSQVKGRNSFKKWLFRTYKKYGIDGKAVEINEKDIPAMSEKASRNVNAQTNPAKADVADIAKIYRKSFKAFVNHQVR